MRLNIDFSGLHRAVRQMGAEDITSGLVLQSGLSGLDPIDVGLGEGIEVDLSQIEVDNGLLSVHGRQILLYIQDQGRGVSAALEDGSRGRKFHVADCSALKSMRERGRFERYVATNDLSGEFFISGVDAYDQTPIEGTAKLNVCKNCLKALNYKGYVSGARKGEVFQSFTIEEFFSTYSSFFPHKPKRLAGTADSTYTGDWPEIAGAYKAGKQFQCESCRVDLSSKKNLLHVHHINGVKTDNVSSNLQALCADCHRKQPLHDHMFVKHEHTQLINRLRREQGKLVASSWDEVMAMADPSMRGVMYKCREHEWSIPQVGYELRDLSGKSEAYFELVWPEKRLGIAISSEHREKAKAAGWQALSMAELLAKF